MFLPEGYQLFEVFVGYRQYVFDVRPARVTGLDGVLPVGYLDSTIGQKIDDNQYLGVSPMYVPGRVIVWECREPNTLKPDRAHTWIITQTWLGLKDILTSTPSASVRLLFATVLAKFQQSYGSFD